MVITTLPSASSRPIPRAALPASRALRVAYGIDSMAGSGGTELHAVRLAETMAALGVHPVMITLNASGPMGARYHRAGIEVHEFPVSSLVGASAARAVRDMMRFFRMERIDVVHTHDCYTNFLAVIAARLAGVPLVLASKRWTHHVYPQHKWTNRMAYRLAHAVTANSRSVADTVQQHEGIAGEQVVVTPNFLSETAFDMPDAETVAALRTSLGIGTDATVFVIVARLRAEKDHRFLLRAFEQVVRSAEDVHLIVVGDGPERDAIERQIAQCGLGGIVHLVGHSADTRPWLAAADAAVLTSRHEGFPNALLEAMAIGRPVISTSVGGVPDVIRDGENGILVRLDDLDGMVTAMSRLAHGRTERATLGEAARRDAEAKFRARSLVPQLLDWYRAMLARRAT